MVIVPGRADYGKIRPAVVVQANIMNETLGSVIVCPFSSQIVDAPVARIPVRPNSENGLRIDCQIMLDKITSYPRKRVRGPIGRVDGSVMAAVDSSLVSLLGLWPGYSVSDR